MADYSRVSSLEKRLREPSFKKSGSIIPKNRDKPGFPSSSRFPILREIQNLPLASFFAYWVGVLSNLVLTPVAAATSLSIPMAEIATSLGMPIKPVLYSFLYGLDQFFLPYELAPALIMFATGYVRIRYVLVLMTIRMFLVSLAVLVTAAVIWPMMGI